MLDLKSISNKKDHIFFKTKRCFMKWVKGEGVELDLDKTLTAYRHTIYIKGERHFSSNLNELIAVLNKHLPEESKLCNKKSRVKGKNSYLMFLLNKDSAQSGIIVEDIHTEEDETLSEGISLESGTLESTLLEEDVPKDTPDWDYVDSLYDDSDKISSKNALEEYARKFDVELAKNKSFANMVKDFREEVK